jgi:hypothetical protein
MSLRMCCYVVDSRASYAISLLDEAISIRYDGLAIIDVAGVQIHARQQQRGIILNA